MNEEKPQPSPIAAENSERVRIPKDVAAEVDRLIREGLAISAIKQLRATGLGLASSKVYVDSRIERLARPKVSCPYCGKNLKSAKAKQCFECCMDWHDPKNICRLG
ncbi:MAG: hypothetical protein K8T25_10605 [Planctomycetia bacterium]|nr:hypothetical protein [Planctomycetia bacterium]